MSATNFSPLLIPAAPVRGNWRGRLAGWLARMEARRRCRAEEAVAVYMSNHLDRDLRVRFGRSHDDRVWGAGGLLSR